VFTKRNRRLVSIFRKYGLLGIAFLTPVILSIPIGTIVANSFEPNKRKIFLFMFISILFWSTLMVSLFEIFHAKNVIDLQEQITK
jgi:predicted neutral ceramidase superfamily lipid hydrolase